MSRIVRIFGGIGLAGVIVGMAIGVYAFTNTLTFNGNTLPVSLAYNNTTAPAYTASGVHFNNVNPGTWNWFSFNLDNNISNDATITVNTGSTSFSGGNGTAVNSAGACFPNGSSKSWKCTVSAGTLTTDSVTSFSIQITQ